MIRRVLPAIALVAVVCSAAFSRPAPRTVDEDTPLAERMDVINKHMRKLRRMVGDAGKNAESLTLVLEMQQKALEAKSFDPQKLAEVEGDAAKAEFRIDFRVGMHEFLAKLFELEVALLMGDNEAATAVHKQLAKTKSTSHKKFKSKADDDGDDGGK